MLLLDHAREREWGARALCPRGSPSQLSNPLPATSTTRHAKVSDVRGIHSLSTLGLAALVLVAGADKDVVCIVRLHAPVLNAGRDVSLRGWGQVRDSIICVGGAEVASGCRAAGVEVIVHVGCKGLIAGSRFTKRVQIDVAVGGGQLGGGDGGHGSTETRVE